MAYAILFGLVAGMMVRLGRAALLSVAAATTSCLLCIGFRFAWEGVLTAGICRLAQVFISLHELIPAALKFDPENRYTTVSMFIGMAVMALSLICFGL
jgi:hypothetical protein